MKNIMKFVRAPFAITITFIAICGVLYPLLITGLGQLAFPSQANGSIIKIDGKKIGSKLIGQQFTDNRFMQGRPSAVNYNTYTAEEKNEGDYTGVASGSQNLAPSNPELQKRIEKDITTFLQKNPTVQKQKLPADLFTQSASGLDPDITLQSALLQISRISEKTGLSKSELKKIVANNTNKDSLGFVGTKSVNVLGVNTEIAQKLNLI